MKKILTVLTIAALFTAVACGEGKTESNVENEANEMIEDMDDAMEEAGEEVEEAAEDVGDAMEEAGEETEEAAEEVKEDMD